MTRGSDPYIIRVIRRRDAATLSPRRVTAHLAHGAVHEPTSVSVLMTPQLHLALARLADDRASADLDRPIMARRSPVPPGTPVYEPPSKFPARRIKRAR